MKISLGPLTMAAVFAAVTTASASAAQAQQQPTPTPPPSADHSAHVAAPSGGADDCMTAQSKVSVAATTARERLEAARQTNEPARLRAAVDEALIAIGALLAATEPCRNAAPAAAMDHPTMAAPPAAAPAAAPPAARPAPVDPHAGHATAPPAAPARPSARPATRPVDPHAGMAMPPGKPSPRGAKPALEQATDPVCAKKVDPETAPSAIYKGRTNYFCSAADRLKFLLNPETYLKTGGGGQ